jgi:hypothetical protein
MQEDRTLHAPQALHFVTLIKRIIHSILNCLIFHFFYFTARHFVAVLAIPMLLLYYKPNYLLQPFIYVKMFAHQFFFVCFMIRYLQNFPNTHSDQCRSTQYNLKLSTIKAFKFITIKQSFESIGVLTACFHTEVTCLAIVVL